MQPSQREKGVVLCRFNALSLSLALYIVEDLNKSLTNLKCLPQPIYLEKLQNWLKQMNCTQTSNVSQSFYLY